jgi:hypothetical protein
MGQPHKPNKKMVTSRSFVVHFGSHIIGVLLGTGGRVPVRRKCIDLQSGSWVDGVSCVSLGMVECGIFDLSLGVPIKNQTCLIKRPAMGGRQIAYVSLGGSREFPGCMHGDSYPRFGREVRGVVRLDVVLLDLLQSGRIHFDRLEVE